MLLMGLLIVGGALPLAMASPKALALCLVACAGLLGGAAASPGENSLIMAAGVLTAGLIAGAVLRALMTWGDQAHDRELRKRLPRELPQRYR